VDPPADGKHSLRPATTAAAVSDKGSSTEDLASLISMPTISAVAAQ